MARVNAVPRLQSPCSLVLTAPVDNPLAILSTRSDPCRVDRAAEKLALAEAKARLTGRSPTLDGEVVEATMSRPCRDDGTDPDFVPVLVERIARERLAPLATDRHPRITLEMRVLLSPGRAEATALVQRLRSVAPLSSWVQTVDRSAAPPLA